MKRKKKSITKTTNDPLIHQEQGLIIAHFGNQLIIEALISMQQYRCFVRKNMPSIVAGDQVTFYVNDMKNAIISSILPRTSQLWRSHPYEKKKLISANITQIIIVFSSIPAPDYQLIDRYLVAAEHYGIDVLLLLNKNDLPHTNTQLKKRQAIYHELQYPYIKVSTYSKRGIVELSKQLQKHKSILVGQSGVGKSSLINALIPNTQTLTNALSASHQKGLHTTSSSRLYHLPEGGELIDSPGIREFGILHLNVSQILNGFRELRKLQHQCQFRNCRHQKEKGCAIQYALTNKELSNDRFSSYQSMILDLET